MSTIGRCINWVVACRSFSVETIPQSSEENDGDPSEDQDNYGHLDRSSVNGQAKDDASEDEHHSRGYE